MTPDDKNALVRQLIAEEGTGPIVNSRLMPYEDSRGFLTLGFGRNIETRGISLEEAHGLLLNDVNDVLAEMDALFPWAKSMSATRQRVLAQMLFQMGAHTLLEFKRTLAAMQDGRYEDAADGMRKSAWAQQAAKRVGRLARAMETGSDV